MAFAGFCFGGLLWIPAISFYNGSHTTTGIVAGYTEHGAAKFPIFSFIDGAGVTHTIESNSGSEEPLYLPGQSLPIRYRLDEPLSARPSDFWTLWGLPIIVQGVCAFWLIIAMAVRRFVPQPRRESGSIRA